MIDSVPIHLRSPALRWYYRNAQRNEDLGLTAKGSRRRRRANARNRSQKIAMRRERGWQAWNLRVSKLRRLGKTTRGTERIYAVRRGDAMLLKSQIDGLAFSIATSFYGLKPEAQARVLELEKTLSAIRAQLA